VITPMTAARKYNNTMLLLDHRAEITLPPLPLRG